MGSARLAYLCWSESFFRKMLPYHFFYANLYIN